jgi:glucosamine 6-phosphate synthetase-like amidotransferase/phosphosugar isomerase protein
MPFDDETIAKLEKKLIAAGYTDGEWRSIMFKYYGEDYEGMAERARQRAEERELRKVTMDITVRSQCKAACGTSYSYALAPKHARQ